MESLGLINEQKGGDLSKTQAMTTRKRTDALPPPPPEAICEALGIQSLTIDWLAGDGSDRCYYRIASSELPSTIVLMQLSETDAKALREDGYDWIKIGRILSAEGVSVPRLIKAMPDFAALMIEDYGNVMLETRALEHMGRGEHQAVASLYRDAFGILGHFLLVEQNPEATWCHRAFDAERFIWELNFFVANYLEPVAGIELSASEKARFATDSQNLSEFLASYSTYFVHRDFHSRNLMLKGPELAVIDFQDARLGPPAYDLVSLCFDSYIPFDMPTRLGFVEQAIAHLADAVSEEAAEAIRAHWRPMLLQRQLKAIGSFGYLSIKKNRGNYLQYVRPALMTLLGAAVADERWPFLSGELLEKIKTSLEK